MKDNFFIHGHPGNPKTFPAGDPRLDSVKKKKNLGGYNLLQNGSDFPLC
jgi:hypothetical protein